MKKKTVKLEDNILWQEAFKVAEHVYDKLPELPSEEEFNTTSKLRGAANDLLFMVSQALGAEKSGAALYDWANVRRHLFSLKTMYRFAARQKFITVEPDIMLSLDKLIDEAELEEAGAIKQLKESHEEEMKPWLEKYRLWKEMEK